MKQKIKMITDAFLIVALVMTVMSPLRVEAQAGNVTIDGQVTYQPRNWNPQLNNWGIGRDIQIDLYHNLTLEFGKKSRKKIAP